MERTGSANMGNDLGRTVSQPAVAPEGKSRQLAGVVLQNARSSWLFPGFELIQSFVSVSAAPEIPVTTYRIRLVPHLETYRSVHFEPIVRDLKPSDNADNLTGLGTVVKIGRFTDRPSTAPQPVVAPRSNGMSESISMGTEEAWAGAGGGGDVTAPAARDLMTSAVHRPVLVTNPSGAGGGGALTSNKVAFRSKVVSRAHAEFWVEAGGQVSEVLGFSCSS